MQTKPQRQALNPEPDPEPKLTKRQHMAAIHADAADMAAFRKAMGWSQTKAARKLGYSHQQTISHIETGKGATGNTVKKLMEFYLLHKETEKDLE